MTRSPWSIKATFPGVSLIMGVYQWFPAVITDDVVAFGNGARRVSLA
ncbi:MAG TPA: hypothetical protein VGL91_25590 [Acidobacteriota bacterium]